MKLNLDNMSIIVVEPQGPGNIGSIVRAGQNLGIRSIILINPCEFLVSEAYKMAKNAKPLLFDMDVRESLADCLDDHHILIGTTQRRRDKQVPFYSPPELIDQMIPHSQENRIGIVFGRENNGLTNEELGYCNFQSAIPAHPDNTVFNLAQAVLIYAYECFNASNTDVDSYVRPAATKHEEMLLYDRMETVFSRIVPDQQKGSVHFASLFKRVLGRTVLERRDIRLFHKLLDLIS